MIVGCLGKTIQTKMAFGGIYREMACDTPEDPKKNTIGGAMIQEAQHPTCRYHGACIFFETTGNLGAKPETQTQRLKGPVEYQASELEGSLLVQSQRVYQAKRPA